MPMWVLGCVFALVGVPFVGIARYVFARDRKIAGWPRAPGVVVGSHVGKTREKYKDRDGHYYDYTAYRPSVRYTYTVEGKVFEGESISRSLDGFTMGERAARALVDKYPANREVMVLYDPSDPKTAHLEVRRSTGGVILFAFGCLWLALGTLLLALSFAA